MACNRLTKIFNVGAIDMTKVTCVRWAEFYRELFGDNAKPEDNVILTINPVFNEAQTHTEEIHISVNKVLHETPDVIEDISIVPVKMLYEKAYTMEKLLTKLNKVVNDTATTSEQLRFDANKKLTDQATTDTKTTFVFTKTLNDSVRISSNAYIGDINLMNVNDAVSIIEAIAKELDKDTLTDLSSLSDTVKVRVFERSTTVLGEMGIGTSILGVG